MAISSVAEAAQDMFHEWSDTKDWVLPEKCESRAKFFAKEEAAKVISSCTAAAAEL